MSSELNLQSPDEEVKRILETLSRLLAPYGPQIRAFFQLSEAEQINLLARGFIKSLEDDKEALESKIRALYMALDRARN